MAEIEQYFKSVESEEDSAGAHAGSAATTNSKLGTEEPAIPKMLQVSNNRPSL
jgi:hypothetical protein